jgi:hypothetical protein
MQQRYAACVHLTAPSLVADRARAGIAREPGLQIDN